MKLFHNFGVDYRITGNHLHIYGTNNAVEWLVHLFAFPVKTAIGRVHLGWYLFTLSIYPELRYKEFDTISGHSLGGPVAVYLGKMLEMKGHWINRIDTFGSPRVGSYHFCTFYPIPVHRHVASWDLIPLLPFWFSHVGVKKYHKIKWTGLKDLFWNHQPVTYQKFTSIKL
jgi:hypothetical protein